MSQITERYVRNLVDSINKAFAELLLERRGGTELDLYLAEAARQHAIALPATVKAELVPSRAQSVHFGGDCLKLTVGDRSMLVDETGMLVPDSAVPVKCEGSTHRFAEDAESCQCGLKTDAAVVAKHAQAGFEKARREHEELQKQEQQKVASAKEWLTEKTAERVHKSHLLLWAGYCRGEIGVVELWEKCR